MKLKQFLLILGVFSVFWLSEEILLPAASASWDRSAAIAQTTAIDFFKQGLSKLAANDYRGAIEDLTEATRLNPNFADAYAFRCEARTQLLDLIGAIADCNQALQLDPDSALAYFNRGDARADLQDIPGAIEDFTEVIRRNPLNRRLLAEAYLRRGASRAYYFGEKAEGLRDIQTATALFRQQGNTEDYQRALEVLEVLQRRD